MKSSKGNNNEVLNLSLSLKNIAKMSDEEILSKIGEAKIVKEIYDEFADLYARLNYTDDFAKMFAEKPELIFEYEKAVKDLKFDFNIVENSSNTFDVGKYVSVVFPEKIKKEFKDEINNKVKKISNGSSWEYFTVSFRVKSKCKSEDYFTDKKIKSELRYNNNFRAIKELLYNETKENKKRFADIITELLLE